MIIKDFILFTYKLSITGMNGGLKGKYKCKVGGGRVEATLYYITYIFFVPLYKHSWRLRIRGQINLPFCLYIFSQLSTDKPFYNYI